MIRKLALAVVLISGLVAGTLPALAQSTNALSNLSSLYGNWVMTTSSPVGTAGAATVTLVNCYVNVGGPQGGGNRQVFPLATNVPITVVDGANTETLTPSAVSSPQPSTEPAILPYTCSFTATFSNTHGSGVQIISGDAGRAEAANDNGASYPLDTGVILLSGHCIGTASSAATDGLTGLDPGLALACSTVFAPSTAGGTSIPRAGVLKGLSITSTAVGVNGSDGVATIYKNGSATSITCTVGTGTSCSDTTHTVAVVAGDIVSIAIATQTSTTLANLVATLEAF